MATTFVISTRDANWYWCAVINTPGDWRGETEYTDGYAVGDAPTENEVQEACRCNHQWVAGMMVVHDEDVESVAAIRPVVCEKCDRSYNDRNEPPLDIIEFEVTEIVR